MPAPGDIVCGTRTTNGAVVTVPKGRVFCADISIAASMTLAATATPRVTTAAANGGTNIEPAAGTVVAQLSMAGLALTTIAQASTIAIVCRAVDADIALNFDTGGASSASVTINGFLL